MDNTYDFGNGPVPAHKHANGGGWVADTATVAESSYVGPDAKVFDNAQVSDNARVYGDAEIYGNASRADDVAQIEGLTAERDHHRRANESLRAENARLRGQTLELESAIFEMVEDGAGNPNGLPETVLGLIRDAWCGSYTDGHGDLECEFGYSWPCENCPAFAKPRADDPDGIALGAEEASDA